MVDDQKVAEERRVVSVKMAGELAVQNEEVEKRSIVVEEDLGKAEPALLDAQSAVRGIKRSQLDEIRNLLKPPEAIRMTMEAVLLLLGHEETAWPAVRKIMKGHDFIHNVVDFQSDQISDSARETIRKKYVEKRCVYKIYLLYPFIAPSLPYLHLCTPGIHVYTPYTHHI